MILASDFSGIAIAILWAVMSLIAISMAAGAVTAGLIAKFVKRPQQWWLYAVGWCGVFWGVVFEYPEASNSNFC